MKGISEEWLKDALIVMENNIDHPGMRQVVAAFKTLLNHCYELNDWKPIDENTPKDKFILVYAPGCEGLGDLITKCLWHDAAGFCIDMIREPTYWADLPTLPKEEL